ncbi:MAG: hypothetical protein CVU56_08015 [Deltaproteobacteria bacterium HGW-Deltaproteobacteria-14]|nr:MAG: hypothetical protein CVU56_08015 [Deltaproteobacteria bacterium HGW-Deltaproteobacteria-14]
MLALATLAFAACSLPDGDQSSAEQAYYRLLAVRSAGDVDGLWGLLDPAVRDDFERWYGAEQLAAYDVRTNYPEADKAAALEAIDGGRRADLPSAQALFAAVLKSTSADALGGLDAMSAHARSVAEDEATGRATVKTWGGDELTFVRGPDDRWYWGLQDVERERLKGARQRAEENLARVRANLKKLGR